jgi:hypothetical protein
MNYQRLYDELISYRLSNPAIGYVERHHILPKSMGGSDDPTNLVVLSGREHWVAHLLLYKIHKNRQTMHACHMMAMRCEERGIPRVRNSRMYQRVRESLIPVWRANGRKRVGPKNGSYGTRWICNIALQKNKKISKETLIPNGWIAGRNKWIVRKKKSRRKPREENGYTREQNNRFLQRTKRYSIEGKLYFGLKSICDVYKMTHPAVINRLRSENFPLWFKAD